MSQIWLHVPTFIIGLVTGDFIEFVFNDHLEESYWIVLRDDHLGWEYIGDL